MSLQKVDVVIVGAGPTGLSAAAELTRLGISPVILDRLEAGANTSRAAVIHARTLEVLQPLGITDQLLAEGVIVPTFRVRDRSRILASLSFKHLKTEFPFTLMCPQNRTEAILLSRLNTLGGAVCRQCEVVSLHQHAGGTDVQYTRAGTTETIQTKWLVGCDGGHSLVREEAGIGFEGSTYEESFILADVEMDWPLDREEVSLFFSDQGLVVVAPLPENHFRIVATVSHAEKAPSSSDFESILKTRGPKNGNILIKRLVWSSRFKVSHRVADMFWKGSLLLAGDAAHVHSPAGGQGMNIGIQDAISLANVLAQVLRGGSESLLDDWQQRRRKTAKGVVQMTDRMTVAATASSPLTKMLRNVVIGLVGNVPFTQEVLAKKLLELDS